MSDQRFVHPSTLGWPLYICIGGIVYGGYVFATANLERLPTLGRKYEEPDHSMKYTLWFQGVAIEWQTFTDEPQKIYAQVGIQVSNGGKDRPIVVEVERLGVELNGVESKTSEHFLPLRLLPDQSKRFLSDRLDDIPHGNTHGEIIYSLKYGPVSKFPVYRRTHKVHFQLRRPITPAVIQAGGAGAWTWTELAPELDFDVYPPPAKS